MLNFECIRKKQSIFFCFKSYLGIIVYIHRCYILFKHNPTKMIKPPYNKRNNQRQQRPKENNNQFISTKIFSFLLPIKRVSLSNKIDQMSVFSVSDINNNTSDQSVKRLFI